MELKLIKKEEEKMVEISVSTKNNSVIGAMMCIPGNCCGDHACVVRKNDAPGRPFKAVCLGTGRSVGTFGPGFMKKLRKNDEGLRRAGYFFV